MGIDIGKNSFALLDQPSAHVLTVQLDQIERAMVGLLVADGRRLREA
jgi:hypothetical protein